MGTSYYAKKNFKKGDFIKKIFLKKKQPCVGITDLNIKKYLKQRIIVKWIKNRVSIKWIK